MKKIIFIILSLISLSSFGYGISNHYENDMPKVNKAEISKESLSDPSLKDKTFEELKEKFTDEEIRYIMRINEMYGPKPEDN